MWFNAINISLLPSPVRFPTHFKPTLFSQHTPLVAINLWRIQWTTQKENKSSVFPKRTAKVLYSKLSGHIISRFKKYYYITQKLLKSQQQSSCPHTTMDGQGKEIWIQFLIVALQNWMNKYFHHVVELNRSK